VYDNDAPRQEQLTHRFIGARLRIDSAAQSPHRSIPDAGVSAQETVMDAYLNESPPARSGRSSTSTWTRRAHGMKLGLLRRLDLR
jgi:hypothetical protein